MRMIFCAVCLAAGSLFATEGKVVVPVYDLVGLLSEGGQVEPNLFAVDLDPQKPITHFDVMRSLDRAVEDENVPGVVVEMDQAYLSLAQIQEVKRGLRALQDAGKEVWVYADGLNVKTALIGSGATRFVMNPEGEVMLTGLFSESLYFKGLLDKLGVVADVVHIGDFKSAGENLYRKGPSQAARQQTEELFDSLFNSIVTEIATGRGITRDSLLELMDQGFVTAENARQLGLVDALDYRTEFVEQLREEFGSEAEFAPDYVNPGGKEPEIGSFFDLMKLMFSSGKSKKPKEDYVGVVALDAAITFESVEPVRKEVLKLARDEKCQALVLRVNSPGGSALASEILWEAVDEFQGERIGGEESEGRPVVVSMGAVAASGGYYISSGADHIVAEATTLTGSIGVVGMKLAMGDALERLGITTHETKRGEHADAFNSTRPFSKEERRLVRESMLDVYRTFKERVREGRGDRLVGKLEALAGGRVYTGRDALRIGLVDELGGVNDAIERASELAGLDEPPILFLPEPVSPLDALFNPNKADGESDEFLSMSPGANRNRGLAVGDLLEKSALQVLPVNQRRDLQAVLSQLRAFEQDRIQLIAPPVPSL